MRLTFFRGLVPLVSLATSALVVGVTSGEARAGVPACIGDCDQDQQVAVDELILIVNLALGAPLSSCTPLTESPTVADVVRAVSHSLNGCPQVVSPPPPVPGETVLLNEVVFDPGEGEFQFVELKIGTGGSATDQLSLRNHAGEEYALPDDAPQPVSGGLVLIVFDGQAQVTGGVVHAELSVFLDPRSGSVALVDETGAELDRVAWGAERLDAVPVSGGIAGTVAPGTSIARLPQAITPSQPRDWTFVPPSLATAGEPNDNPPVGQLHPQDGAVMEAGEIVLSWFLVPGASSYRVQVASDAAFSTLVADEVVARPPRTANMAPGRFFWRVQAIAEDGRVAASSYASELELVADLENFASQFGSPPPAGAGAQQGDVFRLELTHRLPLYAQRKDTRLLLLESDQATGTAQAWNAPHPGTDENDPADNSNCAHASTSMVNAFFAGESGGRPNLSQDRISLELYTKHAVLWDGPVWDLNYGRGTPYELWKAMLEYALGATVQMRVIGPEGVAAHARGAYDTAFREQFWNELIASLARDRPVPFSAWNHLVGQSEHAMVARGALQSGALRYVWLNDPWHGRSYLKRLDRLFLTAYYILPDTVDPASDEADLRSGVDSDRDQIIDFDEDMRFGTGKLDRNSDEDCIDDFAEIEMSVLDEQHGWGQYWGKALRRKRPNADGAARGDPTAWAPGVVPESEQPELTIDSDGGGLPDFVEDIDRDGTIATSRGESDPFDPSDDARKITGNLERIRDRDDPPTHFVRTSAFTHDLETEPDGTVSGMVHLTFNAMSTFQASAAPPQCPDPRLITTVWDEVTADFFVDGQWTCNPDPQHPGPNLILTEREPQTRVHQLTTIMDPCLGTTRGDAGNNYTPYVGFALSGTAEQFSSGPGRLQWKLTETPNSLGDYAVWDLTMVPR